MGCEVRGATERPEWMGAHRAGKSDLAGDGFAVRARARTGGRCAGALDAVADCGGKDVGCWDCL